MYECLCTCNINYEVISVMPLQNYIQKILNIHDVRRCGGMKCKHCGDEIYALYIAIYHMSKCSNLAFS